MNSGKVKVIFIGGAGRSGSTLLDRILGQIDGFCSLGEMYHIWQRSFIQNQLCGCGTSFNSCSFWQAIVQEAFVRGQSEDGNALLRLQRSVARLRNMPSLLFHSMRSKSFSSHLSHYVSILERFYKAIAKISGCSVLVDSSKLPPHGLVLSEIPGIDLYVLHLVRDSRAVAYSWQRKKLRPEIYWKESYMPRMGLLKGTYEWLLCNFLTELLSKRAHQYKILSYEEFTKSPRKKVDEVVKWLGMEVQADFFIDEWTVDLGIDHTVSGNPVRFTHGPVKIKSDAAWRGNMPFIKKYIVFGLTFPLFNRYHLRRA
jgi:hypothetical protein